VWELDGPMPTVNKSKGLKYVIVLSELHSHRSEGPTTWPALHLM